MAALLVSVIALFTLLVGCEGMHHNVAWPVTTGWDKPNPPEKAKDLRFVVWGDNPVMVNKFTEVLHQQGRIVIERARLDAILREQQITLTHTPDDEADLLRVGQVAGADAIVFTEVETREQETSAAHVWQGVGGPTSSTAYFVTVAFRVVDVETGKLTASGSGTYDRAISGSPRIAVQYLTEYAIAHSLCAGMPDRYWIDPAPGLDQSGCLETNGQQTLAN